MVPCGKLRKVVSTLKTIHAQEAREAAGEKAIQAVAKLKVLKLAKATAIVEEGYHETLSYFHFPEEHWRLVRTNNMLERVLKEIRRRTRVVGSFPDGNSALMLAAARPRHVSGSKWGRKNI